MFTFNGLSSTDDEQLYITLTESMANGKGYSALTLLGNDRLQGSTGSVEPLHPLLGIPLYHLANAMDIGKAQVLFILPAVYTALTGVLLTIIVKLQGYEKKTALFIGLAYGLGTIAFPYARMNFREPLAALALTFAIVCFEYQKQHMLSFWKRLAVSCLIFLSLGIAALTKITTSVTIPFFLAAYLAQKDIWSKGNRKHTIGLIAILAAAILVVGAVSFIVLPPASLNRFTLRFADYIRYTLPRLPHDHFLEAMAGLFFSPGKGLFIYSPILIFALLKPSINTRSNWIMYYGAAFFLAVTQALIYNDEWWGITWGTRALLPVLPLVMLASLPAINRVLASGKSVYRHILYGLMILSIFIQGGRLVATDPAYVGWLASHTGTEVNAAMQWNISIAPIYRHWWLGIQNPVSDIAWLHTAKISTWQLTLFIVSGVSCFFSTFILATKKKKGEWISAVSIIGCAIMTVITPMMAVSDMRYYGNVEIMQHSRTILCELADEDDLILIDFYLDPYWWYFSNYGCHTAHWAGLPYVHNTAIHGEIFYPRLAVTEDLIKTWLQTGDVYLVSAFQIEGISYSTELSEKGFEVTAMSQSDIKPLEILQIK